MKQQPLADALRPSTLDEYVGQEHLTGPDKPLRKAIDEKLLLSFILWGPPGVGKTTLARLYARALDVDLYELSAVSAGKADIKKILANSTDNKPLIIFLDEIHRFNKAQQDFLLPFVENGSLILIGATTENPSFEVIAPLLSRCRVFVLHELTSENLHAILKRTKINMDSDAQTWLVNMADGDARRLLTTLEATYALYGTITVETLQQSVQSKHIRYDKKGEEHYNVISAFIKSMRAGSKDAAMYYLARMIESGEDPKFIARRMVIFASEDIGLAQPTALVVANAVFRAVEIIGYPECSINLAQGVAYLAGCKKNRSAYDALRAAQKQVQQSGALPVPLKLRNAPTKLMKEFDYGSGYEMYSDSDLLPEAIKNNTFFKH